jgi:hypothetical protein
VLLDRIEGRDELELPLGLGGGFEEGALLHTCCIGGNPPDELPRKSALVRGTLDELLRISKN